MEHQLELINVSKLFGDVRAVDDVSGGLLVIVDGSVESTVVAQVQISLISVSSFLAGSILILYWLGQLRVDTDRVRLRYYPQEATYAGFKIVRK